MENFQWEGITQFIFPEEVGSIDEVISVNVKPQWQQVETDDSLRLIGIYYIQSVIRFNKKELPNYSEGILIDTLEFNGDEGYFEYAYPLEVDLPKELLHTGQPRLEVSNIQFFVLDGSCCTFRWDVQCIIEEEEDTQNNQVHIMIESSNKSFHHSQPLPEHLEEDIQYEVNLISLINNEEVDGSERKDTKISSDLEEQQQLTEEVQNKDIQLEHEEKVEEQVKQLNDQFDEIESIEVEQTEQSKVIEVKNEIKEQENAFVQQGFATNILSPQQRDLTSNEQPSVKEQPTLKITPTFERPIIGKQLAENDDEKQQSDDFLESLKEDYTVFNLSNNILRK